MSLLGAGVLGLEAVLPDIRISPRTRQASSSSLISIHSGSQHLRLVLSPVEGEGVGLGPWAA